jgi:hypothetical protein
LQLSKRALRDGIKDAAEARAVKNGSPSDFISVRTGASPS